MKFDKWICYAYFLFCLFREMGAETEANKALDKIFFFLMVQGKNMLLTIKRKHKTKWIFSPAVVRALYAVRVYVYSEICI